MPQRTRINVGKKMASFKKKVGACGNLQARCDTKQGTIVATA
jgi:hypothetical protein